MADLDIKEIEGEVLGDKKYKITEPRTIKDINGNSVIVPGESFNLSIPDIDKMITSTQKQLVKWQKVKAEIEKA